jgi:hypothetical protein
LAAYVILEMLTLMIVRGRRDLVDVKKELVEIETNVYAAFTRFVINVIGQDSESANMSGADGLIDSKTRGTTRLQTVLASRVWLTYMQQGTWAYVPDYQVRVGLQYSFRPWPCHPPRSVQGLLAPKNYVIIYMPKQIRPHWLEAVLTFGIHDDYACLIDSASWLSRGSRYRFYGSSHLIDLLRHQMSANLRRRVSGLVGGPLLRCVNYSQTFLHVMTIGRVVVMEVFPSPPSSSLTTTTQTDDLLSLYSALMAIET